MSLPTASVPNTWPGENIGRFDSRTSPPTGAGSPRSVGPREQPTIMRRMIAAGIVSSGDSVRRPRRRTGSAAAPASSSGAAVSGAAMAHTGVEDRVEQVRDQVRDDHHDREDEDDAL